MSNKKSFIKISTNINSQQEVASEAEKRFKEKEERIKKYRQEASRMASMANKRLKRLEKNGLQDTPAYQKWIESGGEKFGVRGKDYNEVQREMARMRQFINSQTSTIKGVNNVLKEMANNTGIQYKNLKELRQSRSARLRPSLRRCCSSPRSSFRLRTIPRPKKCWQQESMTAQSKRLQH